MGQAGRLQVVQQGTTDGDKTPLPAAGIPTIPTGRHLRLLALATLLLAAANVADVLLGKPFWSVTRVIDLSSDDNVAAWYSSVLLALGALAAFQCFQQAAVRRLAGAWVLLGGAALMIFMSCDEIAHMHEIWPYYVGRFFGIDGLKYASHSAWVVFGGPVIAAIFAVAVWQLWRPLQRVPGTAAWLLWGFAVMFGAGVILESSTNLLNHQKLQFVWDMEVVAEETLEMLGSLAAAMAFVKWRDAVARE